jgi:hypothetical protein
MDFSPVMDLYLKQRAQPPAFDEKGASERRWKRE